MKTSTLKWGQFMLCWFYNYKTFCQVEKYLIKISFNLVKFKLKTARILTTEESTEIQESRTRNSRIKSK